MLSIAVFMHRVHTKISPPVFNGNFQRISHLYSTRSSDLNFSKHKLKLTKTKYIISIRGLAILTILSRIVWKAPIFKVKIKSKQQNFDDQVSYF